MNADHYCLWQYHISFSRLPLVIRFLLEDGLRWYYLKTRKEVE